MSENTKLIDAPGIHTPNDSCYFLIHWPKDSLVAKVSFSCVKHSKYVGALFSIWGFFTVMRFPHNNWYMLLALETDVGARGIAGKQYRALAVYDQRQGSWTEYNHLDR